MVTATMSSNRSAQENPFWNLNNGQRSLLASVLAERLGSVRDLDVNDVTSRLEAAARTYVQVSAFNTSVEFIRSVAQGARRYGRLTDRQVIAALKFLVRDEKVYEALIDDSAADESFEVTLPAKVTKVEAPTIPDGYYTVVMTDGTHVTLRILTNAQKGYRRIAYLAGPANTSDYVNFGTIRDGKVWAFPDFRNGYTRQKEAAAVLLDGQIGHKEAGKAFAMMSGRCWKCNAVLTDPESIRLGIGPVCRGEA